MTGWETVALGGMGLLVLIWISNLLQVILAARDLEFRITADRYEGPAPGVPLVSVVVPARNEARNIGACLDALAASDHDNLEILVVDDRSEDDTRTIVEARATSIGNVKLIEGQGPPPGWMGKVAAVWRGQQEAKGQWLLFLDADVRITESAVRQCLHYVTEEGVEGISLIGFLENKSFWERVVQPVVGSLILAGNKPSRVNDPARRDAMANGQFIFVSREAYDAVGGHEALKGEILDDVGFARLMKSNARTLHLCYGREIFRCRMYEGLAEIWEGWSKNLFPGLHHSILLAAIIWLLVFGTALLPFGILATRVARGFLDAGTWTEPMTLLSAATVALIYGTYAYGLHVMRQPVRDFWSYPLGVVVLLGILLNSTLRIRFGLGVTWKGRRLTDTGTGGPKVEPTKPA